MRNKQHAQHAEKMAEIIKGMSLKYNMVWIVEFCFCIEMMLLSLPAQVKELTGRCSALEAEVLALLNVKQAKTHETTFFCPSCSLRNKSDDENCLENQLLKARAEVVGIFYSFSDADKFLDD